MRCQWVFCKNESTRTVPTGNLNYLMMRECGQADCARYRYRVPIIDSRSDMAPPYLLVSPGLLDGMVYVPADVIVPAGMIAAGTEVIQDYVDPSGDRPVTRSRRIVWGED